MSTHMFLWRTDDNYPLIIIKYPPYLVFCQERRQKEQESWSRICPLFYKASLFTFTF